MQVHAEKEVEELFKVLLPLTPFAGKVHSVGGFNRDTVLGLEAKDLDAVVSEKGGAQAFTHLIFARFGGAAISTPRQLGSGYPIWQITFKEDIALNGNTFKTAGAVIEFADTMKESFPDQDSRQREVEFGTLDDDIKRRDFACNMLLKDLTTGEFKDLAGTSMSDIKNGVIRGHPEVSLDKIFNEDPLRMLRLVRFHCKFGWKIPLSVLKTVRRNAHRIAIISAERIMGELSKVMDWGKLHKAVRLMDITGLLPFVFPEVAKMKGCKQHPKHHTEGDAFRHTMLVLSHAKKGVEPQLAALLHDIGKPATQRFTDDNITFYGHEDVGAEMTESILYRMKFEVKTIRVIKALVKHHMRPIFLNKGSEKAIRKWLREVGDDVLADMVLDLGEADALGSLPPSRIPHNYMPDLRQRVKDIRESPAGVSRKPILSGDEVIAVLGLKRGPIVGEAIEFLKELADDLASNKRELTKDIAIEQLKVWLHTPRK